MKDRGGKAYLPLWARVYNEPGSTSSAERAIGSVRQIGWLSPSRQADKALGLSGRQLKKYRKSLRRGIAQARRNEGHVLP